MGRTVKYLPDGKPIRVSSADVESAWPSVRIPALFAVETARHESGFSTNEVDTEPSGFVSKGIFQLSDDEAKKAGYPGANLLALGDSSAVFSTLMERNLDSLISTLGHTPSGQEEIDIWAYLFISHNQGLGAAQKTIKNYGMNWEAYKKRNMDAAVASGDEDKIKFWNKVAAYGDDVSGSGNLVAATVSYSIDAVTDNLGVTEDLNLDDSEKLIVAAVGVGLIAMLGYAIFI